MCFLRPVKVTRKKKKRNIFHTFHVHQFCNIFFFSYSGVHPITNGRWLHCVPSMRLELRHIRLRFGVFLGPSSTFHLRSPLTRSDHGVSQGHHLEVEQCLGWLWLASLEWTRPLNLRNFSTWENLLVNSAVPSTAVWIIVWVFLHFQLWECVHRDIQTSYN